MVEFVLIIVNTSLVVVGGYLFSKLGMPMLGIACWVAAGLILICYIFVRKLLPLARAKQTFLDAALRHHFIPLNDHRRKDELARLIKTFSGFDDLCLKLSELRSLENNGGVFFAGEYALSGEGLEFGYFLLGILRPHASLESLTLSKRFDRSREFTSDDELALSGLPRRVTDVLREFPYEFHFRNNFVIANFDSYRLRTANFGDAFDSMLRTLSILAVG